MFCANCGAENDDGVAFCSLCGKSPNEVVVKNEEKKMENYPLINLSSKLFYQMFELVLWLFLIIGTVGGGIAGFWIGKLISGYYNDKGSVGAFLGVIIGFFLSFVVMINYGGKTSITLKANAEKVLKK
jgi:hypothetical protein